MNICVFAKSTLAHRMGGMEVQGRRMVDGLGTRRVVDVIMNASREIL